MPATRHPRIASLRRQRWLLLVAFAAAGVRLSGCKDFGAPVPVPLTIEESETRRVTSLTVVSQAAPSVLIGGHLQFLGEARDAVGAVLTHARIAWTSDSTAVATIDSTGLATGVASGTAPIRARSNGVLSTPALLSVITIDESETRRVASLRIVSPASPPSITVPQSVQFQAEARDSADAVLSRARIDWRSDSTAVATIDASGLATGVAAGTAPIRASSNGVLSAPLRLTVKPAAPDFATQVQPIFTVSCAIGGCHSGTFPSEGLNLSPGRAYGAIVNKHSTQFQIYWLVKPGDSDSSAIYLKVASDIPPSGGTRMPQSRPALRPDQIEMIRAWIAGGAKP